MKPEDRNRLSPPSEVETNLNPETNRRLSERRVCDSKGYCYISMVGWMDRREKHRRQDDDGITCSTAYPP